MGDALFYDRMNDGIQTRAVSAARQYSDTHRCLPIHWNRMKNAEEPQCSSEEAGRVAAAVST
jgi:hypothetical protein